MIGDLHDQLYLAAPAALGGALARHRVAPLHTGVPVTSQAPVSVRGWGTMVGGGLALWALLIALLV